jgi:predicted permease
MKTLTQDLKYAARTFLQNPAFTLAVLVSLAIGIGANTALFSVTSALLLRPLPYEDPERLVILWNRSPGLNITEDWFSTAQYFDIKTHSGFEQAAIAIGGNENLTGDGKAERVGVIRISSNLLPMLGIRPLHGRLFTAEEDTPGRPRTALLSYGMWERRYGRDAQMLGKKLLVNGEPFEVVGILPRSFTLPREVMPTLNGAEQAEILLPLPLAANAAEVRTREDYNVMARLKPGVSVAQAQAEMETITARLRRNFPEYYPPNGGLTFGIVPLAEQVTGDVRRPLYILIGAVGFVLLIACANVANLLLSRGVVRQKEIAVRQALGANAGRIVRQLLTESVLLALAGGAVGVLLALGAMKFIHVLGPKSVPRVDDIAVDGFVLLFTLLLSVFSGIVFGLAPALRLSKIDLHTSLKEAGRGSSGASAVWGRGSRLRKLLVVAQLALSVVLLIGAGLLMRSFVRLHDVHPGFNPKNVLTFGLTMTGPKYQKREIVVETYRQLCERLAQLTGVSAAGAISSLPLSEMYAWGPITVEGRVPLPGEQFINVDMRMAAGNYFEAMEIPLLRGRYFNEFDTSTTDRVALIDEFMATELWPGQDPVGKRFHYGGVNSKSQWITVIGIVGRVKQYTLDADSRIAIYLPHTQYPVREMNVVLRSKDDAAALAAAAQERVQELDADLPVYGVRTMEQRLEASLARRRFSMVLLGIFAALALVLATLGIYSVMAYLVAQGTREIGIRMALGATRAAIVKLILRHGMALASGGVLLGLVGALALTQVMESLLFGVRATDPVTFSVIAALLGAVALLACFVPARRAARVDPMISLRWE